MRYYVLKNKLLLILSIIAIGINALSNVLVAVVLQMLFDNINSGVMSNVIRAVAIAFVFFVSQEIVLFISSYITAKYVQKTTTFYREDILNKILNKDINKVTTNTTSDYISMLTNDMRIIEEDYFKNIISMCFGVFGFVFGLGMLLRFNVYIGIFLFFANSLPLLLPVIFKPYLENSNNQISIAFNKYTQQVKDIFDGIYVINFFDVKRVYKNKFKNINEDLETKKFNNIIYNTLSNNLGGLVSSTILVIVYLASGYFIIVVGSMTLGMLMGITQLLNYTTYPILELVASKNKINSIKYISDNILSIANSNTKEDTREYTASICNIDRNSEVIIRYKNVNYNYIGTTNGIHDVSFDVIRGKKYMIVGKSGSGKSTAIKLLLKYFTTDSGEVILNGFNINEWSNHDLYSMLGIVSQHNYIFNDSVKNNICLYNDYSEAELNKVLRYMNLYELVSGLPNGIDTIISDSNESVNLSGGERQRIAIARAIIANREVLILDEAFSALDNITYTKLEDELLSIENLTVLSISHKVTNDNINKYDGVLVFEKGELIEILDTKTIKDDKTYINSLIAGIEYE